MNNYVKFYEYFDKRNLVYQNASVDKIEGQSKQPYTQTINYFFTLDEAMKKISSIWNFSTPELNKRLDKEQNPSLIKKFSDKVKDKLGISKEKEIKIKSLSSLGISENKKSNQLFYYTFDGLRIAKIEFDRTKVHNRSWKLTFYYYDGVNSNKNSKNTDIDPDKNTNKDEQDSTNIKDTKRLGYDNQDTKRLGYDNQDTKRLGYDNQDTNNIVVPFIDSSKKALDFIKKHLNDIIKINNNEFRIGDMKILNNDNKFKINVNNLDIEVNNKNISKEFKKIFDDDRLLDYQNKTDNKEKSKTDNKEKSKTDNKEKSKTDNKEKSKTDNKEKSKTDNKEKISNFNDYTKSQQQNNISSPKKIFLQELVNLQKEINENKLSNKSIIRKFKMLIHPDHHGGLDKVDKNGKKIERPKKFINIELVEQLESILLELNTLSDGKKTNQELSDWVKKQLKELIKKLEVN